MNEADANPLRKNEIRNSNNWPTEKQEFTSSARPCSRPTAIM